MKTYFRLFFIILFVSCLNNPSTIQKQTKYELRFDKMFVKFQDKSQSNNVAGKIILLKNEIQVIQGNQGEKFKVKNIESSVNKYTIFTVNNQNAPAIFRISKKNDIIYVVADLEGVIMDFNITSGRFEEILLYQSNKLETKCDCETINRDDGTVITQCNPLPVANDNSTQVGLAVSSNGLDVFVALTVRFASTVKEITGDLSLRLMDNNMLTLNLINAELGKIGNNQVAMAVFIIDAGNMSKLKQSALKTISFRTSDGLLRTYECTLNSNVLARQLNCI